MSKRDSVKSGKWAKAARAQRLARSGTRVFSRLPPKGFKAGTERVSGFYGRFNQGNKGDGNEDKFFDTAISFTCDATAEVPATGQLNLIPQGITESTRVARKACIKSIHIRAQARFDPAATTFGVDSAYVYVVLDKQCNGAAAAATDVLTSTNIYTAMINMANSERFVILKRFVIPMQATAGVQGAFGKCMVPIEWYKKVNIPLEFSSNTGAITEIKSNNVFLIAGSGFDDDLTNISGTCRIRFSDN